MTQLTENIIAIENPDWGRNTRIVGNVLQREVLDFDIVEGSKVFEWIDIATLPPGNWEIVGESDKMDEEAFEYFHSLLRYHNIETNHLIIKKID